MGQFTQFRAIVLGFLLTLLDKSILVCTQLTCNYQADHLGQDHGSAYTLAQGNKIA